MDSTIELGVWGQNRSVKNVNCCIPTKLIFLKRP